MEKYILKFKYVYSFYSFDEELDSDVKSEQFEVSEGSRFKLYQQEDSTFLISSFGKDHIGRFAVLTYPNKDNIVVHENDCEEFVYDEFFDAMGDNNHNVYEGTVELVIE